jgi:propanol-preferring alcohol dehydrogenase
MRAVRLTRWKHDPELREVPDPEPGPGEVVVRIGGAGACHSDLHMLHDFEPGPWPLPFTLGHENAGWVHALGAGVTGWEVGQPVAVYGAWGCGRCRRCRQGMENHCERLSPADAAGGGIGRDGGMAEYLLVPSARQLVPLDRLAPAEAAPLTDAGLTPYHAIQRSLALLVPGSTAVVIGAGGLGHMAIQILARLCPARIAAVDKSPAALELARRLGAEVAVSAGESAAAEIREATGGKGADLVLDFVGVDETLRLAAAVARALGHVTLIGVGGGSHPFGFFSSAPEVSFATGYWGSLPELMEVVALAEAGHLRAHVRRFRLDEAVGAYHELQAGRLTGRAVIVP